VVLVSMALKRAHACVCVCVCVYGKEGKTELSCVSMLLCKYTSPSANSYRSEPTASRHASPASVCVCVCVCVCVIQCGLTSHMLTGRKSAGLDKGVNPYESCWMDDILCNLKHVIYVTKASSL